MPLVLIKPPKPIGDMTDDELDALADRIFDGIKSKFDGDQSG
jgi:hypothetical protein